MVMSLFLVFDPQSVRAKRYDVPVGLLVGSKRFDMFIRAVGWSKEIWCGVQSCRSEPRDLMCGIWCVGWSCRSVGVKRFDMSVGAKRDLMYRPELLVRAKRFDRSQSEPRGVWCDHQSQEIWMVNGGDKIFDGSVGAKRVNVSVGRVSRSQEIFDTYILEPCGQKMEQRKC